METSVIKHIKRILIFWFALFAITFIGGSMQSCAAVDYVKKNCRIETEIGAQSFVCVICDFSNASEQMKKKIEAKLCKP